MIKNIIFDFGDVFINLDKGIVFREMERFGGSIDLTPEMVELNNMYEVGGISTDEFIGQLQAQYPKASASEIKNIWNSMLLDFPEERLEFIEQLAKEGEYRLFLLSNTNALHITHVEQKMGSDRYLRFKNAFEQFYLSHEIKLRKPNAEIYQFVLDENGLKAEETFFIDDTKENTDAAEKIGINCWNIQVGKEDIVQLKPKL
ncbi:putative hydrolase of the HAD superfamily [Zobellia uliginosa]|uniref:Hydrolase of the HAD superfamily n=1 Tax=Zobellia uliginosa TaxID=143224 RepID=A0ABY1KVC8_9FLAO|nr:HAD family phosphatase [Zobellia uliginosa]SIS65683.1 putative hydrolase of the HAD superfamily [Zobellia uliginosa]